MYLMLAPSEYSLGDKQEEHQVELRVEANKVYYIKVKLRPGLLQAHGSFDQVDEEDGEELLEEAKKVKIF